MRITLVINADQGAVEKLRSVVVHLRAVGHEVRPGITFEAGDARRMAREGVETGCELLIAAGGDGTLNEVVNGLHDALRGAGPDVRPPRLGIIPLGTANDFASALQIPSDLDKAVEIAMTGHVMDCDVGMVNGRCFINVSTGGFGAEAVGETPDEIKRALGPLAYVITGVREFATLEVSEASFGDDETIYEGPFLLFAVGNARRTGGGNWLTPSADLTDRMLDLCVVTEMSRVDFIRLLPNLRNGSHLDHPAVIYRRVSRVVVESTTELSVNADGEPLHERRFEYEVSPYRIPVAVPPGATPGPQQTHRPSVQSARGDR